MSKAAAAMTVNSGINKEGKDIYGLAHYCEHMLFLGSKTFDKPTYFVDYITLHGGKFNGYTDFENTGFFFKINSDKFTHALEIFSRFFIDPLFSVEYVKKEVNSVNSEYERNIQLDAKRREMVLRDIAEKESLFHRFSTGNWKTLWEYTKENKIDLRERVLEYYNMHYRPDNMKLIIYGDEPVDVYKGLVDTHFLEMKKREVPYTPTKLAEWDRLPWEYNKIGKLILMKTINNHQELDISIMLDDIFDTLPDNPALYFKILLNYRGRGSLDDHLRKMGFVAGIKSFVRKTYKGFSLFKIKGYITKNGIKNLDSVIKFIFKYIKFVRTKALNKNLYDYIKRVFDVAFFFNKKKSNVNKFMKAMCSLVWSYSNKFLFTQHKVLGPYKEEVIKNFGDKLILKNSIIIVGDKEFDNHLLENYSKFVEKFKNFKGLDSDTILDKSDPFYFTNYGSFNLKKEFIEKVDEKQNFNEKEKNFQLFSHKKALPKNISLVKTCSAENKKKVRIAQVI